MWALDPACSDWAVQKVARRFKHLRHLSPTPHTHPPASPPKMHLKRTEQNFKFRQLSKLANCICTHYPRNITSVTHKGIFSCLLFASVLGLYISKEQLKLLRIGPGRSGGGVLLGKLNWCRMWGYISSASLQQSQPGPEPGSGTILHRVPQSWHCYTYTYMYSRYSWLFCHSLLKVTNISFSTSTNNHRNVRMCTNY